MSAAIGTVRQGAHQRRDAELLIDQIRGFVNRSYAAWMSLSSRMLAT
jgi:hypothetical protein